MKTSYLEQFSILCLACWVMLGVFRLGALYGASPYRDLVRSKVTSLETTIEFGQVTARQGHTLYIVALFAAIFSLLYLATLVIRWFQEKKGPVQFLHPTPAIGRRR